MSEMEDEKIGKWEPRFTKVDGPKRAFHVRYFCSECGMDNIIGQTEYCPWCGAKMEKAYE